MEKCDDKSLTSNNDYLTVDNNKPRCRNNEKCEIIPIQSNNECNKDKIKKSQLLSSDGWESYQKELIRSCFEFWEVNETEFQVDKSSPEDNLANDSELPIPLSLFANENNNGMTIGFNSIGTLNKAINSEALQEKECIDHSTQSKYEDNNSKKINDNCLKIVDNRGNKRVTRKKLKKFSFYKHISKQIKTNEKVQSLSIDRYASYTSDDVWAYKIWLESVEKNKDKPNINITKSNVEKKSNHVICDITNNTNDDDPYYLDIEAKQIDQKVKKLIKSLKEKNKLLTDIDVNGHTSTFRSSKRFKYFFNSAFRGNQNEFDRQLLDDYTKYINRKLHTWQTLLHCLNDIRQREPPACSINTSYLSEDSIKYRFSEHDRNDKLMDDYDGNNLECIAINGGFNNGIGKQKSNKFFKLLSKTKSTVDMRTAVKRMEQNSVNSMRVNQWTSNQIDEKIENRKFLGGINGRGRPEKIRKSLSDTDLQTMGGFYTDLDERPFGNKTTRNSRKALAPLEMLKANDEDNRHWDDMARELWEEQQECFHTVKVRLEYVGSTFTEHSRLAGLKTLCKVDVLARLGHSAEAVDLFVSTLPLSNNPDLMIHRAKAAYDWKFYCHLSIWHHSYRD